MAPCSLSATTNTTRQSWDRSKASYSQLEAKKKTLIGHLSAAQEIEQVGSWHSAPKLRVLEEDDRLLAQSVRKKDLNSRANPVSYHNAQSPNAADPIHARTTPTRTPTHAMSPPSASSSGSAATIWPGVNHSPIPPVKPTPTKGSALSTTKAVLWTARSPADDIRDKLQHLYPQRETASPSDAHMAAARSGGPACLHDGCRVEVQQCSTSRSCIFEFFQTPSPSDTKNPKRACDLKANPAAIDEQMLSSSFKGCVDEARVRGSTERGTWEEGVRKDDLGDTFTARALSLGNAIQSFLGISQCSAPDKPAR